MEDNHCIYLFDISGYDDPAHPQFPYKGYPDHNYNNWASIHGMAEKMLAFIKENEHNTSVLEAFSRTGNSHYLHPSDYSRAWKNWAWKNDQNVCYAIIADFCRDWCRYKNLLQ